MISCIAYNRKKMMAKRIGIDEGLVGRCIYEKAPIILTEVPQDYLVITSGMGDRRPDFLAIVPLLNNEDVVGVVEVASFDEKPQYVLEYLEKAAESLASACSIKLRCLPRRWPLRKRSFVKTWRKCRRRKRRCTEKRRSTSKQ